MTAWLTGSTTTPEAIYSIKIIDVTGLTGTYDFTLTWTLPFSLPDPDSGQTGFTLFEAIGWQLGLKLRLQKHPMPVLVIDHHRPHRPAAH